MRPEQYWWDCFTRVISFVNAVFCINGIVRYILPNPGSYLFLLAEGDDGFVNTLYCFAAYLFVDGLFNTPQYLKKLNTDSITSLLHHYVGGLGIYMIAANRNGLGLGAYFAATEISTPLLNISWFLHTNKIKGTFTNLIFGLFYIVFTISRILTIPFLMYYLYTNNTIIGELSLGKYIMVYGGSLTLVLLNVTWFAMLTKKMVGSR